MSYFRSQTLDRLAGLWIAALLACVLAMLCGCGVTPQRGGKSHVSVAVPRAGTIAEGQTVVSSDLQQPENPKDSSQQETRITEESEMPIPAGSVIKQATGSNTFMEFTIAGPANLRTKRSVDSGTRIGAAQKDTARELAAKLSSMRPVQVLGALLVLASLAMFHPAVATVVASKTVQWVCGGVGLMLLFAPVVVVDMAPMIQAVLVFGGIAVVVVWFLAGRNASHAATANALQQWVDANNDGRDDLTGKTKEEAEATTK